uniref:Carboxylesterase type B domain-containing protein n=1 Tax=Oncorhynchus mykiss TaxID=8022 RepID=A0A8K9XKN7_ONCMY
MYICVDFQNLQLAQVDDLIVATNRGRVRGTQLPVPSGGCVRAFLGIPYLKPPRLGNFVNYTCLTMNSLLPGFCGVEMWNPNSKMSEDCLYLNIWTLKLIYLYLCLQCTPIIKFVLIGHRLGPLYFQSLPDSEVVRGDDGMHDQRVALYWVANNITAFGRDPSKVTQLYFLSLFFILILCFTIHGLFNRAKLQSGSPNTPLAVMTQQQAWNRTLSLGRLMGLSPDTSALPFTPSVDQDFLPDMPEIMLRTGNFLKTEVLIGSNQDEWTHFLVYGARGYDITSQSLISREDFLKGVDLVFMGFVQYTEWRDENSGMKNRDFIGPENTRGGEGEGKACLFLFDHHSSNNPWPVWMGVMQGYEIAFIFGMPLHSSLGYIEEEVVMSRRMMKSWANMGRTG